MHRKGIYHLLDALSEILPTKIEKVWTNCGSIGTKGTRFQKNLSVKFPEDHRYNHHPISFIRIL